MYICVSLGKCMRIFGIFTIHCAQDFTLLMKPIKPKNCFVKRKLEWHSEHNQNLISGEDKFWCLIVFHKRTNYSKPMKGKENNQTFSLTLFSDTLLCYITPTVYSRAFKSSIRIILSHRLSCATGASSIVRARPLWCGGTCLWCPHTPSQSGLWSHRSGTQRSNEDRDESKYLTKHTSCSFLTSFLLLMWKI